MRNTRLNKDWPNGPYDWEYRALNDITPEEAKLYEWDFAFVNHGGRTIKIEDIYVNPKGHIKNRTVFRSEDKTLEETFRRLGPRFDEFCKIYSNGTLGFVSPNSIKLVYEKYKDK